MDEKLEKHLKNLETSENEHLEIKKYIHKAHGGDIYPFDVFADAVLNRSLALISGFCQMIRAENFICAAPLVRLQLDNWLRLHAAHIFDDPHEFTRQISCGKKVGQLRDKHDQKMSDSYLVKQIAKEYPWVERVYHETSGYVHLSAKHIANVCKLGDSSERSFYTFIGAKDKLITDADRIEAVNAMIEITQVVLQYVNGWAYTKDNLRKAQDLKKETEANNGMDRDQ